MIPRNQQYSAFDIFLSTILFLTFPLHWAIFIAASVIALIPALMIRNLVQRLVRKLHPTWGPMVSTKDGVMAEDSVTYKPNGVITSMTTMDGSPSLEEVQERIHRDLVLAKDKTTGKLLFPKFQQYMERFLGYNFWIYQKNFRIENHVRYLLPDFRTGIVTEDEVQRQLSLLVNQGFKPKHPHWEILYIKNYLPKTNGVEDYGKRSPKSVMIYRVHHGIGDGYSLMKSTLLYVCNDNLEKVLTSQDKNKGNVLLKLWSSFYQIAMIPCFLFRQVAVDIDSNIWFLRKKDLTRESHVMFTKKIPINTIKEIRKKHGVTLTSVLYAVLGGAIGKYFKTKYVGKDVPEMIRSFTPFPWKNHPDDELTNHWTCAVIPILTGISCPLERLKKCEEELTKVKGSSSPLSNYVSMRMVATLPGFLISLFGQNWYSTCILSNFPGPTKQIKGFKKYPFDDFLFLTPHLKGRAGIGISISSYADNVRFVLNFDKAIIPLRRDLEELKRLIEDEVDVIHNVYLQNEQVPSETPAQMSPSYNRFSGIKAFSSKQA